MYRLKLLQLMSIQLTREQVALLLLGALWAAQRILALETRFPPLRRGRSLSGMLFPRQMPRELPMGLSVPAALHHRLQSLYLVTRFEI